MLVVLTLATGAMMGATPAAPLKIDYGQCRQMLVQQGSGLCTKQCRTCRTQGNCSEWKCLEWEGARARKKQR